jgi:hypothetical protein
MKTLEINIEDKYLDSFLIIINSMKDGMIKNFNIIDNDTTLKNKTLEDIKNGLEDIKNGDTYDIDTLWDDLDDRD